MIYFKDYIKHINGGLIKTYPGDVVFDPFGGSFTSCISAKLLGRIGVGCEINKEMYYQDNLTSIEFMLKELGVDWTLIGHSERRSYFGETNLICNKKMIKASQEGFTSVYCVGESSDDYDHGRTKGVIRDQLLIGLAGLSSEQMQKVVIAYEPVWSIGTGKNASKEHAQDIANYIRERLEEMFSPLIAEATLVLYGGSVKPNNIKDYLTQPDVDGALVGGASLKVSSFEELLTNMIG
jgi:triosephosphate isomerase